MSPELRCNKCGAIEIFKNGRVGARCLWCSGTMEFVKKSHQQSSSGTSSIADEITKLAKLKADGLITDEEFTKMKQDLISKK